ncbi:MAG TPA: hypothetical protein VKA49_22200, partial [Flavitalea sp.]|nr:hypothetical protein [Flavitalea sp.]
FYLSYKFSQVICPRLYGYSLSKDREPTISINLAKTIINNRTFARFVIVDIFSVIAISFTRHFTDSLPVNTWTIGVL